MIDLPFYRFFEQDSVENIEYLIDQIYTQVKYLITENNDLKKKISKYQKTEEKLQKITKETSDFYNSITPIKVYHCKKRGNTSVKFMDGSSVTVKKIKGEKDCLETAIVYALFKKMYPKQLLKSLVKDVSEEEGVKE